VHGKTWNPAGTAALDRQHFWRQSRAPGLPVNNAINHRTHIHCRLFKLRQQSINKNSIAKNYRKKSIYKLSP